MEHLSIDRQPVEAAIAPCKRVSVSSYLATRLVQAGVHEIFTVPGDFILFMLDEFIRNPQLELVGCCNELNAGST